MNQQVHSESLCDSLQCVERRAVIDVGTNSVKLLVADVGRLLKPVLKLRLQTVLGQGAFRTRRLRPDAMARTVDVVADFAAGALELCSTSIRVLATSASRESTNSDALARAIQCATGLTVEVISGEQEADYVFEGVTSDPAIGPQPILIVKVGGGSTEWVAGENGSICFRKSTRIGTVRLLEFQPPGDPPSRAALARLRTTVRKFIQAEVGPSLRPVLRAFCGREVRLVGSGGSLRALVQLSSAPVSGQPISLLRVQVVEQVERLWGLSVQERRQISGLDPQMAEVILPGAVLYEAVLDQCGFDKLLISNRGLREGTLLMAIRKQTRVDASTLPDPIFRGSDAIRMRNPNLPSRQVC
ncbi:MAG: hypothetical protein ACLQVY_13010 [Limisphaerales bacterium]